MNERIHLTEMRAADAAALVDYLNEPEIYARTLRIPSPYRAEDAARFLGIVNRSAEQHGFDIHFVIRDSHDNLLGGIGFDDLVVGHRAELGYWLAKPFWGQGIMTEVVRAVCDHAMGPWNLVRITAHVFDFNAASARVLEKNGFTLEGQLRRYHQKDGKFIDSNLYALIAAAGPPP